MELKKSVIDFVIVSSDIVEYIESIHMDDERINILTRNTKTKNGTEVSKSDHNIIDKTINIRWIPKVSKIVEVFRFKDTKAEQKFKVNITETKALSKISDSDKPLDIVTSLLKG